MKFAFKFLVATLALSAVQAKILPFEYTKRVLRAEEELRAYALLQKSVNVQNVDLAYAVRKALVMADLLILADGTLNVALCPMVAGVFIPEEPQEYEVNMAKVLAQLDPSWQPFFAGVKAPMSDSTAALVLRALFSLEANQQVTDRHAKVAVLSALLSPCGQEPVTDCFALKDGTCDHQEYYRRAARDYQSIVTNGYILRVIGGVPKKFFFRPVLKDQDRDHLFVLHSSNMIADTYMSLLNAPGFTAALALMGGTVTPEFEMRVVQSLSQNAVQGQVMITPSQVIKAIAETVTETQLPVDTVITPPERISELCALGEYGFSALTNNTVVRAVEAAYAAMAEDCPHDLNPVVPYPIE